MSQSITVNQVTLIAGQATKVVSANVNRIKITLTIQGGNSSTNSGYYMGTSNSVNPNNGFPFLASADTTDRTFDWQTELWIYNSNLGYTNPQCYFIDEASS